MANELETARFEPSAFAISSSSAKPANIPSFELSLAITDNTSPSFRSTGEERSDAVSIKRIVRRSPDRSFAFARISAISLPTDASSIEKVEATAAINSLFKVGSDPRRTLITG